MRTTLVLLLCLVAPAAACQSPNFGQGFIYGRVTHVDGTVHEGRLRWGGDEEVLWNQSFYGVKAGNPWARYAPEDALTTRRLVRFLGLDFGQRRQRIDLERPLLVRFGDLARIEARGRDLDVTLRSGRVVELDRYEADDFADGLRIEGLRGGVVDIDEWAVRRVDFMAAPPELRGDRPLQGTVHAGQAAFTGLIQWDRVGSLAGDRLVGYDEVARIERPFGSLRAIERSDDGVLVRLNDGGSLELHGTRATGDGHRGVYVDDPRYGRVLVPWSAFKRVEFSTSELEAAPGYDDFRPGRPIHGAVTTREGRRLAGRIVFDLDEGETVETLDAPGEGVHYNLPFELVASIDLSGGPEGSALVTLRGGEVLELSRQDDLGPGNAGLLVFAPDGDGAAYVAWSDVVSLTFD